MSRVIAKQSDKPLNLLAVKDIDRLLLSRPDGIESKTNRIALSDKTGDHCVMPIHERLPSPSLMDLDMEEMFFHPKFAEDNGFADFNLVINTASWRLPL